MAQVAGGVTELHVRVVSARNLKDVQTFGKQDPYCRVTVGGRQFTTSVHDNGGIAPVWNEKFVFQVYDLTTEQLCIQVLDKNFTSSKTIGECRLQISMFNTGKVVDNWFSLNKGNKKTGDINLRLQLVGHGAKVENKAPRMAGSMIAGGGVPYGHPVTIQHPPYGQPLYGQPQAYPPSAPPMQSFPQSVPPYNPQQGQLNQQQNQIQMQQQQIQMQQQQMQQQHAMMSRPMYAPQPVMVTHPTQQVVLAPQPRVVMAQPTAMAVPGGYPGNHNRHHGGGGMMGGGGGAVAAGGLGLAGGMLLGAALNDWN